jgi:hypothetical protein
MVALVTSACASRQVVNAAQCQSQGGTIQGVGMFATPACVIPYADAGKVCSDRSDCTGLCKTDQDITVGQPATGTCQRKIHDNFGCYNEVKGGVVLAGMCVD